MICSDNLTNETDTMYNLTKRKNDERNHKKADQALNCQSISLQFEKALLMLRHPKAQLISIDATVGRLKCEKTIFDCRTPFDVDDTTVLTVS